MSGEFIVVPRQDLPYFLPIGRHPHPQLLRAGGFVTLAFLLTVCLRIFPHLLLVRISSAGVA